MPVWFVYFTLYKIKAVVFLNNCEDDQIHNQLRLCTLSKSTLKLKSSLATFAGTYLPYLIQSRLSIL